MEIVLQLKIDQLQLYVNSCCCLHNTNILNSYMYHTILICIAPISVFPICTICLFILLINSIPISSFSTNL